MARARVLYGRDVCRRCWSGFTNLRQLAWVIDAVLVGFLAELLAAAVTGPADAPMVPRWSYYVILAGLFAAKDGFGGHSLGKAICGFQVVDRDTGEPASFLRCAARNWFLAIPLVAMYIAMTMGPGPRLGDRLARTRVIRRRQRDNPVFAPAAVIAKVFE
jgi:uncharacterized RDD family membrane protein YckC